MCFNLMLQCGYLQTEFICGILRPNVKTPDTISFCDSHDQNYASAVCNRFLINQVKAAGEETWYSQTAPADRRIALWQAVALPLALQIVPPRPLSDKSGTLASTRATHIELHTFLFQSEMFTINSGIGERW
jgi:hypothetical protein